MGFSQVFNCLITAYGGIKEPPPFQQGIAQSPGYVPVKNNPQGRLATFNAFLNHTGCSDVQCLRQENTSILTNANDYMTTVGAPDGVGFGPVVDDDLVPDLPGKLLSEGKYHRTLRGLVSANNAHEGGLTSQTPTQ
ncbi:hypothetical protein DPV78_005974 [Talaromyces pinophilus]|nr:hypothetical protein DPV78_005974 [Talaromyces pinophilus]